MLIPDNHDELRFEIRSLLATLEPSKFIPPAIVQRLQGLHAILQIQDIMKEDEFHARRRARRGLPEGYELTTSARLYGFRKKGDGEMTIAWKRTPEHAIRAAWDHVEAFETDEPIAAVVTTELSMRAPSPAQQQAMIDAVLVAALGGSASLDELVKATRLPSELEAVLVVDHLVTLGFLEEVKKTRDAALTEGEPVDMDSTDGPNRFFRFMREI